MCDIWKDVSQNAITPEQFRRHLASVAQMHVEWIVFSGGEPLMHPRIFDLCDTAKRAGARVTMLSTGLLISRNAERIIDHVDDMIVSLDGPEHIHNAIRRVSMPFRELSAGVKRLHSLRPSYQVAGRCTVQLDNCESLLDTVAAARKMGLSSISFLAVDVHSTAFNRASELNLLQQRRLAVPPDRLAAFEAQIEQLIQAESHTGFIAESPEKLRRLVIYFQSYWSKGALEAPACNAPWKSAVLEANGTVRPCFFQPALGRIDETHDLKAILNGQHAVDFRASLDVQSNPLCQRCVCSLNWKGRSAN
jgi:radical SAM protein with 4Fe4S-binding SPASM domain